MVHTRICILYKNIDAQSVGVRLHCHVKNISLFQIKKEVHNPTTMASFLLAAHRPQTCLASVAFRFSRRQISSSKLTIERSTDSERFNNRPKNEDLLFGETMSDHMLMVEWDEQNKWGAPKIVPYQNLQISPVASCLNYGEVVMARIHDEYD